MKNLGFQKSDRVVHKSLGAFLEPSDHQDQDDDYDNGPFSVPKRSKNQKHAKQNSRYSYKQDIFSEKHLNEEYNDIVQAEILESQKKAKKSGHKRTATSNSNIFIPVSTMEEDAYSEKQSSYRAQTQRQQEQITDMRGLLEQEKIKVIKQQAKAQENEFQSQKRIA